MLIFTHSFANNLSELIKSNMQPNYALADIDTFNMEPECNNSSHECNIKLKDGQVFTKTVHHLECYRLIKSLESNQLTPETNELLKTEHVWSFLRHFTLNRPESDKDRKINATHDLNSLIKTVPTEIIQECFKSIQIFFKSIQEFAIDSDCAEKNACSSIHHCSHQSSITLNNQKKAELELRMDEIMTIWENLEKPDQQIKLSKETYDHFVFPKSMINLPQAEKEMKIIKIFEKLQSSFQSVI